jgi:predicted DsbA family dithiol-disulfide isomerase
MMARLAHQMAMVSKQIVADVIEITEFPYLAQRYHIFGVPKTVINDAISIEGAVPEAQFLAQVLAAAGRPAGEIQPAGGTSSS